jgi:subtilisin family serine protease
LVAAERADSAGVDIITSSLGYTTFDKSSDSYKTTQLDGNTALITKAADYAAATGMLVVTAAGNEGTTAWKKISFPADADSVLSVGAINKFGVYVGFSSSGPTADGRIKPDVMAMGSGVTVTDFGVGVGTASGTSVSTPITSGLAAGLWQAFPDLTNMELLNLIKRSATKYTAPDTLIGYGIPSYVKAKQVMTLGTDQKFDEPVSIAPFTIYPNPIHDGVMYVFFNQPYNGNRLNFSIHDVCGREVLSGSLNTIDRLQDMVELDIFDHVAPGLYVIHIFSGNKISYIVKVCKY